MKCIFLLGAEKGDLPALLVGSRVSAIIDASFGASAKGN